MQAKSQDAPCSCESLLEGLPLACFPDTPPDHVCKVTQMELCERWLDIVLPIDDFSEEPFYPIKSQFLLIGTSGRQLYLDESFGRYRELNMCRSIQKQGRLTEAQASANAERICQLEEAGWQSWHPLIVSQSEYECESLLFPIREQISQGAVDPKLDKAVKKGVVFQRKQEQWQNNLEKRRNDFERRRNEIVENLLRQGIEITTAENFIRTKMETLNRLIQMTHAPYPYVRSAMLNSFVFARADSDGNTTYEIDYQIEGGMVDLNPEMMNIIGKQMKAHREWMETLSGQRLIPDLRKFNAGKTREEDFQEDINLFHAGKIKYHEVLDREKQRFTNELRERKEESSLPELLQIEEKRIRDKMRKAGVKLPGI